ncbi:hypothetical protein AOXY_G30407 [Acipenser oxyrinchus oxyrinchus]|uniref:Uncharacterized protein n=1 Tax=Acipenser oxyrinchus oxyrinchus TaxID=40147 RepID=A0AAD8CLB2_ACIOX|nr:hypothetical protein AOXY_G30407 [Acipenser oxyrinchus oxyrinchus]
MHDLSISAETKLNKQFFFWVGRTCAGNHTGFKKKHGESSHSRRSRCSHRDRCSPLGRGSLGFYCSRHCSGVCGRLSHVLDRCCRWRGSSRWKCSCSIAVDRGGWLGSGRHRGGWHDWSRRWDPDCAVLKGERGS